MKFQKKHLALSVLFGGIVFAFLSARTSGLDVQLKDLRHSFYYLDSKKKSDTDKNCKKLSPLDIRTFGRLIHCDPEEDHVVCRLKTKEKLVAFEAQADCEKHFNARSLETHRD